MKFRNLKIGTKTSIVSGLSILASFAVLVVVLLMNQRAENKLRVEEQEFGMKELLKSQIVNLSSICSGTVAPALYNFESELLKTALKPYMESDEIKGISIFDAEGNAFFAIWKDPAIKTGLSIPEEIQTKLQGLLVQTSEPKQDDEIVGKLSLYYSEQRLKDKIAEVKKQSSLQMQDTIIFTLIMISIIFIILIALLLFTLNQTVAKPLHGAINTIVEITKTGNLSHSMEVKSNDEIGVLGETINKMIDDLNAKAELALDIARGDLSKDVTLSSPDDTLGNALHEMTRNLNDVISGINSAAQMVSSQTHQVADSSNALSDGASKSAASIEEITSSMTEIGSQTKINADNASQANKLSTTARSAAEMGNAEMSNMIEAINDISQSSTQIAKIIKVIDDIAFQTNLLALNAAVEAARAGRHGKGFAVVAEEVRSLAGRSAKAANETEELIQSSTDKVKNGTAIASKTGKSLEEIVDKVIKVTDLVGEIAHASNEQAQGISQVSLGLQEIDGVTQQNTASSEEIASSAREMSSQAIKLQDAIAKFRLNSNPTIQEPDTRQPGGFAQSAMLPQPVAEIASGDGAQKKIRDDKQSNDTWGKSNEEIISLGDDDFGRY